MNLYNKKLLSFQTEGIIKPSTSPWLAQVVVVKDPFLGHKKILYIDFSRIKISILNSVDIHFQDW